MPKFMLHISFWFVSSFLVLAFLNQGIVDSNDGNCTTYANFITIGDCK